MKTTETAKWLTAGDGAHSGSSGLTGGRLFRGSEMFEVCVPGFPSFIPAVCVVGYAFHMHVYCRLSVRLTVCSQVYLSLWVWSWSAGVLLSDIYKCQLSECIYPAEKQTAGKAFITTSWQPDAVLKLEAAARLCCHVLTLRWCLGWQHEQFKINKTHFTACCTYI